MRGFELLEPRSLAEACSALGADMDARAIAGGTALLTIIKQRLLLPKSLVSSKRFPTASAISFHPVKRVRKYLKPNAIANVLNGALVRDSPIKPDKIIQAVNAKRSC
jgi:CO/xanthine dehydrogenase FAD-binding subunit